MQHIITAIAQLAFMTAEDIQKIIPAEYFQSYRMAKYNRPVSVATAITPADGSKLLRRNVMPGATPEEHEQAAIAFGALVEALDRRWLEEVHAAHLKTFGRPYTALDYKVSGVARSEYPENVKNRLRALAHTATYASTCKISHQQAAASEKIIRSRAA